MKKVQHTAFTYFQFVFEDFSCKSIGKTAACRMLVKFITDYKKWLSWRHEGELVSKKYVEESMNFFRGKYQTETTDVLFVMASDDSKWVEDNFGHENDVVLTSTYSAPFAKRQPIFDMAVLAQCNHSIIR